MAVRAAAGAAVGGLVGSAVALASAPVLMPDSYSWVGNTVSESAAQGVSGAWLARLGFVLFGLTVLLIAVVRSAAWGRWAVGGHASFGVFMIAVAAFSVRPWTGAPYDATEDTLHSVAATGMGFAFVLGVVATAARGRPVRSWWPDAAAVVASVAVPLGMTAWPGVDGACQRVMFAIAYAWYAGEAVRALRPEPPDRRAGRPPGR